MCKLRISAHKLNIEVGRYKRNLHIDLLYSKFLVYERDHSKPKFCFNLK